MLTSNDFDIYKTEVKEVIEEAKEESKPTINKLKDFVKEHPWVPVAASGILGFVVYTMGYNKGIKKGPIKYVGDPDITLIANQIFHKAEEMLDLAEDIAELNEGIDFTKF